MTTEQLETRRTELARQYLLDTGGLWSDALRWADEQLAAGDPPQEIGGGCCPQEEARDDGR